MFRILRKTAVNRVTGVANRDLSDDRINQKVHSRADEQGEHGVERLAPREKEQTDEAADDDDGNSEVPVEVLLNVKSVVPAADAVPNKMLVLDGGVHP